jgi:hypothetical protein
MQIVPLRSLPNQTLQVQLNGQACTVNVFQLTYGLFITVYVGAQLIVASVICENLVVIVRDAYLGFSGDFVFVDTQGASDPVYTGLGSRYQLAYLSPAELAAFGLAG